MRNFPHGYKGIVKCLAWELVSANAVDTLGNDRDDYQNMLMLKAVQVIQKADRDDKPFVNTALRNYARDLYRIKNKHDAPLALNENIFQKDRGFEQQVIGSDLLRRLKHMVTPEQWELLMSYMENGCNCNSTWESMGRPGSRSGFHRRISLLRKKCKKLLDEI